MNRARYALAATLLGAAEAGALAGAVLARGAVAVAVVAVGAGTVAVLALPQAARTRSSRGTSANQPKRRR